MLLECLALGAALGAAACPGAMARPPTCPQAREQLSGSWSGLSLERRTKLSPLVFHALAVETYPPLDPDHPPKTPFLYAAQFWLISVYKGERLLAKHFGVQAPVNGVYDIRDRRVNVTGFYRPNATSEPRCWTPVTSQKYYVIFGELVQDGIVAKEDAVMGSTADWTEQNEVRVWRGVGWDEWSDWSACSASCGEGHQQRWRYCILQAGCQGFNKQTRRCNTFSCRGVVAPLSLEGKRYSRPSQWERVPGRETAWRLRPNSYLWLPAAELPFPAKYFRNHFALLLSLRLDPKKPAGGTLFSLRSRRQEECYFAVEIAGQDAIKLVHSGPNGTQSVVIPALLADGKWHQLALGIQDDSSVRSYFDCRWVSTDILKKNSLDIPDDADLVIGYLFSGELEDMILVADPGGVSQQCSTTLTPVLDPLLDAARPHKKSRKNSPATQGGIEGTENPPRASTSMSPQSDWDQLLQDDEDSGFEGSGSNSIDYDWSEWSECSVTCGIGVQFRTSHCVDDSCLEKTETRQCNSGPCRHHRKTGDVKECNCKNGGVCQTTGGSCECPTGYEGKHCERPVCRPHCHNAGICVQPNRCVCTKHFTGPACQSPLCEPECENGGFCIEHNKCHCPPNTTGSHCQNFTCGNGCENGGRCVGPGLCECPHNSTGELCDTPLCEPPCENSATCASGNTCICQPHTSGERCHDKKCEYRPVQVPYTRGFRKLVKKRYETKCELWSWKTCIRTVPEYQTVYKTFYRTVYKCAEQP